MELQSVQVKGTLWCSWVLDLPLQTQGHRDRLRERKKFDSPREDLQHTFLSIHESHCRDEDQKLFEVHVDLSNLNYHCTVLICMSWDHENVSSQAR